jgi:hypothetical protein
MYRAIYATAIAATLFAVQDSGAAKASTLTYNVTLTPFCCGGGPESGTGSFTITTPAVGTSGNLTEGHGLTAMDFQIDGLTFTMNSSSEVGYYYNGSTLVLDNVGYTGVIGNFELTGISLSGYYFGDSAPGGYKLDTNGSVSVSATPIPTTLPLLASGLGAFALLGLWRKRKVAAGLAIEPVTLPLAAN